MRPPPLPQINKNPSSDRQARWWPWRSLKPQRDESPPKPSSLLLLPLPIASFLQARSGRGRKGSGGCCHHPLYWCCHRRQPPLLQLDLRRKRRAEGKDAAAADSATLPPPASSHLATESTSRHNRASRWRFRLEGVESGRKGCEIERYGRQAGVVLTENTDTTAIRYGKNHFFCWLSPINWQRAKIN